jgi:hypothetical protein
VPAVTLQLLDKSITLCLPKEFLILEENCLQHRFCSFTLQARKKLLAKLHQSMHKIFIENTYLQILLAGNHQKMFLEEATSWPVIMIASPSSAKLTTPHTMH